MHSRSSGIVEKLNGHAYVLYPRTAPDISTQVPFSKGYRQAVPVKPVPTCSVDPREKIKDPSYPRRSAFDSFDSSALNVVPREPWGDDGKRVNYAPRPRAGKTEAGTSEKRKTGRTIDFLENEDNSKFETHAVRVFVGDKSLGSCTIFWPPAHRERKRCIIIKTHGSGYSTKSSTIPVPAAEVTSWYLREAAPAPLALVIRTAAGGELGHRFKDDYEPGTDWLLVVLTFEANTSCTRAEAIAQLRRRLGPTMRLEDFVPTAPPATVDDPDAPVVVSGPGPAKPATPAPVEFTIDDPVCEAIGSLSMHWQRDILAVLDINASPRRSTRRYPLHPT